jgi:hypothetical protein
VFNANFRAIFQLYRGVFVRIKKLQETNEDLFVLLLYSANWPILVLYNRIPYVRFQSFFFFFYCGKRRLITKQLQTKTKALCIKENYFWSGPLPVTSLPVGPPSSSSNATLAVLIYYSVGEQTNLYERNNFLCFSRFFSYIWCSQRLKRVNFQHLVDVF